MQMAQCSAQNKNDILSCSHRHGIGDDYNIEVDPLCAYCGYRSPKSVNKVPTCNSAAASKEAQLIDLLKQDVSLRDLISLSHLVMTGREDKK